MQVSPQQRTTLSRIVMQILDDWEIADNDKITILSLPAETKPRVMNRYRNSTELPDTPEINQRIEQLVAISEALRTTYPHNYRMSMHWLNTPHRRFNQKTPLSMILDQGLSGMMAVRADLDCAYAWSLTEDMNSPAS
ncbi:antitoxin Xre/MbcA/ParS toxin-binding domain-containing protein [Candidatus Albibeggiatoa sp. nov. BB20]|uniref:antitoxin Xre/MbcA/ParS toxin-binding domain-containing protein n=1 Tax=Candidatus Albibeggiatoa sp. nov. BB20 TaxID=3162723 RepID=UPI003365A372